MNLKSWAKRFREDQQGAVTVDWVVLTAAVVGLGVAVIGTVKVGANVTADNVSTGLGGVAVTTEIASVTPEETPPEETPPEEPPAEDPPIPPGCHGHEDGRIHCPGPD